MRIISIFSCKYSASRDTPEKYRVKKHTREFMWPINGTNFNLLSRFGFYFCCKGTKPIYFLGVTSIGAFYTSALLRIPLKGLEAISYIAQTLISIQQNKFFFINNSIIDPPTQKQSIYPSNLFSIERPFIGKSYLKLLI